jgi:hypothetical protein
LDKKSKIIRKKIKNNIWKQNTYLGVILFPKEQTKMVIEMFRNEKLFSFSFLLHPTIAYYLT